MYKKIIITGILAHILAAIFSLGYFQVDEHFQILEFTSYKLGNVSEKDLAWEFQSQIRPAIQPAMAYFVIQTLNTTGLDDPFTQATVLRIISAILSIGCMWLLMTSFDHQIKSDSLKQWFQYLAMMIWFLVYIHVRFSSENWTGLAFWSGFALLFTLDPPGEDCIKKYIKALLTGILFGLAFILRFQSGLMVGGILIWLVVIRKEKILDLSVILIGFLLSTVLGMIVDYWFYGEWTFTAWNYFNINLLHDKVSTFGIKPWWFYLNEIIIKGVPPYSVVLIVSTLLVWIFYPKHPITWITIPFIAVHFLIGHKELRFLFPLINSIPLIIILSIQIISENRHLSNLKQWLRLIKKPFIRLFVIINSICLLVVCFKPADMQIPLYRYIYNHYDPQSTELLYIGRNPFARAVPLNFYKHKNLKIVQMKDIEQIKTYMLNTNKKILFATLQFNLDDRMANLNCFVVYHTLPEFVKHLNFNHWLERTPLWSLYECPKVKTPIKEK